MRRFWLVFWASFCCREMPSWTVFLAATRGPPQGAGFTREFSLPATEPARKPARGGRFSHPGYGRQMPSARFVACHTRGRQRGRPPREFSLPVHVSENSGVWETPEFRSISLNLGQSGLDYAESRGARCAPCIYNIYNIRGSNGRRPPNKAQLSRKSLIFGVLASQNPKIRDFRLLGFL